jgi:hypothetical protein
MHVLKSKSKTYKLLSHPKREGFGPRDVGLHTLRPDIVGYL